MLFLLSLLSFTADTSPPTLLLSQVIFNSFSEATGGAGGQGQDTASSLCCSFFLTQFPHTSMEPLWVVVLSGKYLLQCGLLYGSFVGWSSFHHKEHPFHLLSLVFLLMFLTVSFFPFFLCSALSQRHFQRGAFSFVDGLSCVLAAVHCRASWSCMCLAWGSPWPFPKEATYAAPNCQRLATWTQFNIISRFPWQS